MDLAPLNFLLNAGTKVAIEQAVLFTFLTRNQPLQNLDGTESSTHPLLKSFRSQLGLGEDVSDHDLIQIRAALAECIGIALASGSIEELMQFFQERGGTVNPKLQQLLAQIIAGHLESWRDAAILSRITLPKLIDFDWALHFQRASSELSDIQIPSILMSLQVEDAPSSTNALPDTRQVQFELSREALETMIDGLGKIRDQLAAMR
eukprot:gene1588-1153_t